MYVYRVRVLSRESTSPNSLPDLCVREASPAAVLDKSGGRALAVPADVLWKSLES